MKLSKLNNSHKKEVWEWRNEILTRRMSKNTEAIDWNEHSQWFKNALIDKNKIIYIGELNNKSMGIVRFEKEDSNQSTYTISITIAPVYRGKGYAEILLKKAVKRLAEEVGDIKLIIAEIKKENVKSISLFKKCYFKLHKTEQNINKYILENIKCN
ncbi:GNAT family N-acetyltransferase [Prochlorococcus marinus]|uniref:GNAT family N-acetyltransferase n=1 Tax=Prochlorococcus marinus TaxID=1219 RepID=UPI0022B36AA4|nr:GNAT family N-acetyltransferase [Prochlorococcus marinus]